MESVSLPWACQTHSCLLSRELSEGGHFLVAFGFGCPDWDRHHRQKARILFGFVRCVPRNMPQARVQTSTKASIPTPDSVRREPPTLVVSLHSLAVNATDIATTAINVVVTIMVGLAKFAICNCCPTPCPKYRWVVRHQLGPL